MSYFDGVGVTSWPEILTAAGRSGLMGNDPLLRDTNDQDHDGQGSFHDTGNAVDFGDDRQDGSPQQDSFAAWIARYFGLYSLEIIHVNQDGSTVEYKYGVREPTGWYGADTLAAHHNHVHWAITHNGLAAGLAALPSEGIDIMAAMPTIAVGMPGVNPKPVALNMADPVIRTAQALLEARGGMIRANNTDHDVFAEVLHWFHLETALPDQGIFGPLTWAAVIKPLHGK